MLPFYIVLMTSGSSRGVVVSVELVGSNMICGFLEVGYNKGMVTVIAPCFSLSASGLLGKALFYYDTKFGARVRIPKRTFVPPGSIWEVNKEFFKLANTRSKSLTKEQRLAWQKAYPGECDAWRDIFMGRQIEAWTLSPTNNLTWPLIHPPSVGDFTLEGYATGYAFEFKGWFVDYDYDLFRKWTVGSLWWDILDNPRAPIASDPYEFRTFPAAVWEGVVGHDNYFWGGVRYLDGTFAAVLIEKEVW